MNAVSKSIITDFLKGVGDYFAQKHYPRPKQGRSLGFILFGLKSGIQSSMI